jgi:hypothetical protein
LSTPRSGRFTPGKDPVPIVQEAGRATGLVWTGAENLPHTGIRSPDRPARSQSLYRLGYPGLRMLEVCDIIGNEISSFRRRVMEAVVLHWSYAAWVRSECFTHEDGTDTLLPKRPEPTPRNVRLGEGLVFVNPFET